MHQAQSLVSGLYSSWKKRPRIGVLCHGSIKEGRLKSGLKDAQEGLVQAVSMKLERNGRFGERFPKAGTYHCRVKGSDTPGFKFRLCQLLIV